MSMMRNLSSSFDPRTLLSAAAMQAGSGAAGAGGRAGTEVTLVTPAEAEGAGWWRKGGLASGVPLPRLCRTSLWYCHVYDMIEDDRSAEYDASAVPRSSPMQRVIRMQCHSLLSCALHPKPHTLNANAQTLSATS